MFKAATIVSLLLAGASAALGQVSHFMELSKDDSGVVRADLFIQTPPGDSWTASDLHTFQCVVGFGLVDPLDNPGGPWKPPSPAVTPETAPSDTFLVGPGGPDGMDFFFLLEPGFAAPCDVQGPAWADIGAGAPSVAWLARFSIPTDATHHPFFTLATFTGESATLLSGAPVSFEFGIIVPLPPSCAADLDFDGQTGQSDLGILLADYGCVSQERRCAADLDQDGQTGQSDLGLLLADFGCSVL